VRGAHEQWLRRLDEELDNLRAALAQCLLDPDPAPGLKHAEAMSDYFDVRGRAAEGVDVLSAQLDRPEAATPTALRGRALAATARLLEYHVGDYGRAEALAGEALTIGQNQGDEWLVAKARMVLAWARYRQGDAAACQAILKEALPAARTLSDPRLAAHLLNLEGYVLSATGGDAEPSFEEAAALYRRAGDRYGMAVVLANIGGMALVLGDLDRARDVLGQARTIFLELEHRTNLALVAFVDGVVSYLAGDDPTAEGRFRECLAVARRIGGRLSAAYALLGLALTASRAGDHHRAAILHGAFDARELRLDDLEGGLREADRERLGAVLGDRAFTVAMDSGRALALEDAFAFAAEPSSSPPAADATGAGTAGDNRAATA
jgi:tetratricopeptide (TPR) repeat protein